ncbi:MAG: hypothetical protein ACXWV3_10250 [Flavisolibacter sp.]
MNLTDKINQQYDGEFKPSTGLAQSVGIGMVIMYLIIAIIWFFPLLFLLRFANQVQSAILSNNQESLNSAFQNLKVCFRYVGIVTIIGMAFYLLAIVITITTGQTV